MPYSVLNQDVHNGLALLREGSDPPRYYIRQGRRLELIAIGDEQAARSRFAVRCNRARRMNAPAVGPLAAPGHRPGEGGEISFRQGQHAK